MKQRELYLTDPRRPLGSTEVERCILRERERELAVQRGQLTVPRRAPPSPRPEEGTSDPLGDKEARFNQWQIRRLQSDGTGFGFSGGAQSPAYMMTGTLDQDDKEWIQRYFPNESKSTMLLNRQHGASLAKESNARLTDPAEIQKRVRISI